MAVIDELNGLEAWIEIDGVRAQEYDDPDADEVAEAGNGYTKRVVKYIEAKPGASFGVRWLKDLYFRQESHHLGAQAHIDGASLRTIQEPVAGRHHGYTRHWDHSVRSVTTGDSYSGYVRNNFYFANLDKESDGPQPTSSNLKEQLKEAQKCGLVTLHMYSMDDNMGQYHPLETTFAPVKESGTLHEKALKGKAKDSGVGYKREPSTCPAPRQYELFSDREARPFAIFEFRYRYKEGLYQEGIIPRPLSRTASPDAPETIEGMSDEEVRRLAARLLQERNANQAKREGTHGIKRERVADDEEPSQFAGRVYKERRLDNGKVEVDLTDD